jgi:hypothetical protein
MNEQHMTVFVVGYGFMAFCMFLAQPYSSPFLSAEEKLIETIVQGLVAMLWPVVVVTLLLRKLFR